MKVEFCLNVLTALIILPIKEGSSLGSGLVPWPKLNDRVIQAKKSNSKRKEFSFSFLVTQGFEPKTAHVLGIHSATEPHPVPFS